MKKCFIISEIGEEGGAVRRRADQLFNHVLQPVCQECGFEAQRVDQMNVSDSITQTIMNQLKEAELVIADLTGHNPNVFFEIGYRTALGKPIIHLRQKETALPFDIANIRAFDYELTDLDVVKQIRDRLRDTINSYSYEQGTAEEEAEGASDNNQMIALLNSLVYKVDLLGEEIGKQDAKTIKAVVEACNSQPQPEVTEGQIMQSVLMELMRNPKAADSLIELEKRFGKVR